MEIVTEYVVDEDDEIIALRAVGWLSEGNTPVDGNELSYSCTEFDILGRAKRTITVDDEGYEQLSSYIYDSVGRRIAVIGPYGHDLDYETDYTQSGKWYKINVDLDSVSYDFGYVTRTVYEGSQRKYAYDANSYNGTESGTYEVSDEAGTHYYNYRTEFTYDDAGRQITTKYPSVNYIDEAGDPNSGHLYTHVGYDELGRRVWQSQQTKASGEPNDEVPDSDIREFEYDAAGRLINVTLAQVPDPQDINNLTNPRYDYFYNESGNRVAVVDAKGRVSLCTYNQKNSPLRRYEKFNPASVITDYQDVLDLFDDIRTGTIDPNYEEFTYDESGKFQLHLDLKEQATWYVYNQRNQLQYKRYYEQDADANDGVNYNYVDYPNSPDEEIYYTYDNSGRGLTTTIREFNSDPVYKRCYENVYDDQGRVASVNIYPDYQDYLDDVNLIDSVGYGYNEATGRKSHVCTPNADTVEDASVDSWLSYRYDPLGRLADLEVDKRNGVEPNSVGTEPIIEDDEVAYYDYNPVGTRASLEYANGNYTDYQYDKLNRLKVLTNWQTSAQSTILSKFEYGHYANGMRSSVIETMAENRTIAYTYDALNRLTVEDAYETGSGNNYGYTGQYVYDLVGNRRSRNVNVTYYQDSNNPVREQRISTSYSYYSDDNGETDRLHSESHSITQISLVMPDEQIYLYASNGGEFHYTKGLDGKRISQVRAMLLGLPTKLGSCLFYLAMALVVAAFFVPVIASGYMGMRKCQPETLPVNLSLYHRCVLVFLAYALLVGPFGFEQLSHADIQYQDLLASDWGTDGEIITYTYDRNGSVATKVVNDGGPIVTYTNEYNLRNRLAKLTKTTSGQSSEHVTEYKYNPVGIRVCACSYDTTDGGQTKSNEKTIDYLIDAYNHTGYAQTLVEDDGTDQTTYIIGSDVLAQATNSNNPEYLLYDGHGSTRQLLASNGSTVSDNFSYDAYGVMLGGNPQTPAGTNLLYTGEYFDTTAQNYYLRARLYNQNNGLFNRTDPYSGNHYDPQSLHKYLYVHCNPINGFDPSGRLFSTPYHGRIVQQEIFAHFESVRPWYHRLYNDQRINTILFPTIVPWWGWDRPDLVDKTTGEVWEIKPLGSYSIAVGQLGWYLYLLNVHDPQSVLNGGINVWKPGFTYTPPSYVPIDAYSFAVVSPIAYGIIEYEVIDVRLAISFVLAYTYARMKGFMAMVALRSVLAPI